MSSEIFNLPISEEPPCFVKYQNEEENLADDTILYRYMSWDKFVFLIKHKALYMPNSKQFTQDKKEGYVFKELKSYTQKMAEVAYDCLMPNINRGKKIRAFGIDLTGDKNREMNLILKNTNILHHYCRNRFYISCWAQNTVDLDTMWKSYINEDERKNAVAIQTTVGNLKKSIKSDNNEFILGAIKYINFDDFVINTEDELFSLAMGGQWGLLRSLLFQKRKNYSGDNEVRLITDILPRGVSPLGFSLLGDERCDSAPAPIAITVPVDIENLIKKLVLSPEADVSILESINKFLLNNNLKDIPVVFSELCNQNAAVFFD